MRTRRHGSAIVVDDNDIDRMLYERIIARSGVFDRIVGFSDPADALELFVRGRGTNVRAIFTDIRMPAMTGFEFLDRLEAVCRAPRDHVVSIITTSSYPTDIARAKSYRAVKFYFDEPLTVAHVEQVGRYLDDSTAGAGSASVA